MSKLRLIPRWAGPILAKALLIYGPRLVELVSGVQLRKAVAAAVPATASLITAVSDDNPNNAEQVQAIGLEFVRKHAVPLAIETVNAQVAAIGNDRLRNGLTILAKPVGDALNLLTDDNPDNAAQAEVVLDDLILNENAQEFVLTELTVPVLEKVVKDKLLLSFILTTLSTGLKEGAEQLADIEVFNRSKVIEIIDGKVALLPSAE